MPRSVNAPISSAVLHWIRVDGRSFIKARSTTTEAIPNQARTGEVADELRWVESDEKIDFQTGRFEVDRLVRTRSVRCVPVIALNTERALANYDVVGRR